jgi:hypothetical protein
MPTMVAKCDWTHCFEDAVYSKREHGIHAKEQAVAIDRRRDAAR